MLTMPSRRSRRAKPIPLPKKFTKWEQFAKEKGITNKKKARMVWDEEHGEFRPRWGYKRANAGVEDAPIVEVKPVSAWEKHLGADFNEDALRYSMIRELRIASFHPLVRRVIIICVCSCVVLGGLLEACVAGACTMQGDDPNVDPWSEAAKKKVARVQKNLKQQRKNLERGERPGGGRGGEGLDLEHHLRERHRRGQWRGRREGETEFLYPWISLGQGDRCRRLVCRWTWSGARRTGRRPRRGIRARRTG